MRRDWLRVSLRRVCKICGRPDWCVLSADGRIAICMRIESNKRTRNGGWLHRLTNEDWQPPRWRKIERKAPVSKLDCNPIHQRCIDAMRPEQLGWLSNDLGIGVDSIERFEVGHHPDRNVYSMPMRRPDGSICGMKYRPHSGAKFCERGSKSGLFFVPNSLNRDNLVIVEGCSDAMATHDIGFQSVIGRDNCVGNVSQIVTLLRRLKPKQVAIIPDNDSHGAGLRGAEALKMILNLNHPVELLELPDGINDVRDCIQTKENADWLHNRIGEIISHQTSEGSNERLN